jgi:hypothetical protein
MIERLVNDELDRVHKEVELCRHYPSDLAGDTEENH